MYEGKFLGIRFSAEKMYEKLTLVCFAKEVSKNIRGYTMDDWYFNFIGSAFNYKEGYVQVHTS
jgi:hypothetical protein